MSTQAKHIPALRHVVTIHSGHNLIARAESGAVAN